jgi:hypothetical protein
VQQVSQNPLARFRLIPYVLINLLIALIGTSIAVTTVGRLFRPRSVVGILGTEYALSLLCAACLGFGVRRIWKTPAAQWTWVLPSALLLIRFVSALTAIASQSVLAPSNSLWVQFSGLGCQYGLRSLECRNFFVFTLPFLRAVGYSLGACVPGWVVSRMKETNTSESLS